MIFISFSPLRCFPFTQSNLHISSNGLLLSPGWMAMIFANGLNEGVGSSCLIPSTLSTSNPNRVINGGEAMAIKLANVAKLVGQKWGEKVGEMSVRAGLA